ncbi:hypothetical protein MRX96_047059 [Rhipicephalus microplus]
MQVQQEGRQLAFICQSHQCACTAAHRCPCLAKISRENSVADGAGREHGVVLPYITASAPETNSVVTECRAGPYCTGNGRMEGCVILCDLSRQNSNMGDGSSSRPLTTAMWSGCGR